MAEKMKGLDIASWLLCTIGGLNWGLVGAFNFNLVDTLLGAGSTLARIVYIVVGLAALYSIGHLIMWMKK